MESRKPFDLWFRVVLMISLLTPLGCAQRRGSGLAFRPLWGCRPQGNHCAVQHNLGIGGFVPQIIGRKDAAKDGSQDPFLSEQFAGEDPGRWMTAEAESGDRAGESQQHAADWAAALPLSHHPPVREGDEAASEAESLTGNPFRLVEHNPAVNEISSTEGPLSNPSAEQDAQEAVNRVTARDSHLDRLKVALSRDASAQLPPNPARDGTEVVRQRVEAIMKNARRQMQLGEDASALRWAMAAEQLAERSDLFFRPDEDPPADLVRLLQDRLKLPPGPAAPSAKAMAENAVMVPEPTPPAQPPELSVEFPAEPPSEPRLPQAGDLAQNSSTQLHSTRAMQEAAIASDSGEIGTESPEIARGQKHARSLKVDARRVNANQGAAVSVEGQLNPPVPSSLPQLEWAPPAAEGPEPPPFELAMSEPAFPSSSTPPPLPPPSSVIAQGAEATIRLHDDPPPPPAEPVKNVEWGEVEAAESGHRSAWWAFPAMAAFGIVLIGLLLLKKKRV